MGMVDADREFGRVSLQAAFLETAYHVVVAEQTFVLHIGQDHPVFDELLTQFGYSSWAIVTACNPGAQKFSEQENTLRTERLRLAALNRGWRVCPSRNVAARGDWPDEPGLLLPGCGEAQAGQLARAYGQLAFVCGELGQRARLVWVSSLAADRDESS